MFQPGYKGHGHELTGDATLSLHLGDGIFIDPRYIFYETKPVTTALSNVPETSG